MEAQKKTHQRVVNTHSILINNNRNTLPIVRDLSYVGRVNYI